MENTNGNGNSPAQTGGYGYAEHTQKESTFVFGLNAGNVRLKKFVHTMHGGKDGAEKEALDIVFTIDGNERGYRQFPITTAFINDEGGNRVEITDPNHQAFKDAQQVLSTVLVHIVGCFVDKEEIRTALSTRIESFKQYAEILQNLLPANYSEIPLDAFGQYQWNIKGENKVTYLEFPKNMKHGRWLAKAVTPKGKWEKQQNPNASTNEIALRWVDEDGVKHPFQRNGWYMSSNFCTQQKEAPSAGAAAMQNAGAASSGGDW